MPNEPTVFKTAKLMIVSHKPYRFPENPLYVPIRVGCRGATEIGGNRCDNTGENISEKNGTYCELTALYWAWKNRFFEADDYVGLVHYRRYFSGKMHFGPQKILSKEEILTILRSFDVIVPAKRCYCIETVYSHYTHAHHRKDLDAIRKTIASEAPDYLEAFDTVMQQRRLYLYNMFVISSARFDAYCGWLFPLLESAEREIDVSGYDDYQRRVFGFLAERLFNVWLLKNALSTYEVKIVNLEGESLLKKGVMMLKRKFFG